MIAARGNRSELVELLLETGADPEHQCGLPWAKGWTALDHAINERSNKVIRILRRWTKTPPVAHPGAIL